MTAGCRRRSRASSASASMSSSGTPARSMTSTVVVGSPVSARCARTRRLTPPSSTPGSPWAMSSSSSPSPGRRPSVIASVVARSSSSRPGRWKSATLKLGTTSGSRGLSTRPSARSKRRLATVVLADDRGQLVEIDPEAVDAAEALDLDAIESHGTGSGCVVRTGGILRAIHGSINRREHPSRLPRPAPCHQPARRRCRRCRCAGREDGRGAPPRARALRRQQPHRASRRARLAHREHRVSRGSACARSRARP